MKKTIILLIAVVLMAGCATWGERVKRKKAEIGADKNLYDLYGSQAKALENKQVTEAIKGDLVNDRQRAVVFFLKGIVTYSFTVPACLSEEDKQCQMPVEMLPGRYFMQVREIGDNRPFYADWVFIDTIGNNAYLEGVQTGFVFRAW